MKELDKTKRYFLENLNEEQLFQLFNKLNDIDESFKTITFEDFKSCREKTLYYNLITKEFRLVSFSNPWNTGQICATELFEEEKDIIKNPYLTYEEKENFLNNKPMTEEEKELWLFVYKESVKSSSSNISFVPFSDHKQKADQAVKDFREALKM